MDHRPRDPSSSSSDSSFVPFSPYAMPTPAINMQMPTPDMSCVYGQPNAYGWANVSAHPYDSEHLFPSQRPRTPEHSNTFQQSYVPQRQYDIPHPPESPYSDHSELLSTWVPNVLGQAEFNPMDEPICIHTQAPPSPKPSRCNLKNLFSFLSTSSSKSKS